MVDDAKSYSRPTTDTLCALCAKVFCRSKVLVHDTYDSIFQTTGGGSPQQVCVAATTYMYVPATKGTYQQSSNQASKQPYNSLIDPKVLRAIL
jgi:hypothetical protein